MFGDDDFDAVAAEMAEGLDDLNDYSSDHFSLNERRHFFMDRHSISSHNRIAVEFVYMLEAETLTRGSGTVGRDDVKKLCHSKYIELIRQIPANHFAEFGLREAMTERYYGAKKGGASGFYAKVLDTRSKTQSVTRSIDGIGTPLSKIPSGRGLSDVRQQFILKDYKAVMGAVSVCLHSILIYFNVNNYPVKWSDAIIRGVFCFNLGILIYLFQKNKYFFYSIFFLLIIFLYFQIYFSNPIHAHSALTRKFLSCLKPCQLNFMSNLFIGKRFLLSVYFLVVFFYIPFKSSNTAIPWVAVKSHYAADLRRCG